MQIAKKIWSDIKHGENLDLYPLVAVALILAVLNLLGIVAQPLVFSVILAALGFLAVSALVSRFRFADLSHQLKGTHKETQEWLYPLGDILSRLGTPAEIDFEPTENGTGKFYKRLAEYVCNASAGDEILVMAQSRAGEPKETQAYQNARAEYINALQKKAREPNITYRRILCLENNPGERKIQSSQVRRYMLDHSREILAIRKTKPGQVSLKTGKVLFGSDVFILKDKIAFISLDIRDPSTGYTHVDGAIVFHSPPNGQIIQHLYSLFMMTDEQSVAVESVQE